MPPPAEEDILSYILIFSSATSTVKAIKSFAANAKKGSLRAAIAKHLQSKLTMPNPHSGLVLPSKQRRGFTNPYYDLWAWSCQNLEWAGPTDQIVRQSHHILPVFYHHYGCVVPSFDALSLIQQLSNKSRKLSNGDHADGPSSSGRPVVEIGSGNGYWAKLLRRLGVTVHAVDNGASLWRTMWIKDTIKADGVSFLKRPPSQFGLEKGAKNAILLLVYPQVSGDFTGKVLAAFEGDTVVVAGTQNANGFTTFAHETISEWMQREKGSFEKAVQIPLPSFAGKDEALYIYRRPGSWDSTSTLLESEERDRLSTISPA